MSNNFINLAPVGTFLVAVLLGGCASTPQTRDEHIALMKSNPSWTIVDTYTSSRPFDEVVVMIDKKWQECYNVNKTTSTTRNGLKSGYKDEYHPKAYKVSNSLTEMTLQMTTSMMMLNKVPPGGFYFVALDLQRLSGNKTKLNWYSTSEWKNSWEKNKQWSEGKNVSCE